MLIENTLLGEVNKVEIAIERLRQFEPPEGYYLAFSGGKDSICIYQLALMSGVKFDAHFNFTTVDPPELLKFIKDNYPDVIWERPEKTMWQLIVEYQSLPTRLMRFCCKELKEKGGTGRFVITGVRRAESTNRSKREMAYYCYENKKKIINPIIDWTEKDVWQFIRSNNFKYPSLYDGGYKRIGCVMCPMKNTKGMLKDIKRYPNFYKAYYKAVTKLTELRRVKGLLREGRDTPESYMNWWIYGKDIKGDKLFEQEQVFNYE